MAAGSTGKRKTAQKKTSERRFLKSCFRGFFQPGVCRQSEPALQTAGRADIMPLRIFRSGRRRCHVPPGQPLWRPPGRRACQTPSG